jgi:hypothetical protein
VSCAWIPYERCLEQTCKVWLVEGHRLSATAQLSTEDTNALAHASAWPCRRGEVRGPSPLKLTALCNQTSVTLFACTIYELEYVLFALLRLVSPLRLILILAALSQPYGRAAADPI